MPTTSRLNWPYPNEYSDPYWEKFKSFVEAVDASFYSTREDKNFVLFGGGTVSFDATSGDLTWSEALQAVSSPTGFRWYIPSSTSGGSVTLQDGEFFYVMLTRNPQSAQSVAVESGSKTPVSDDAIVIAQRLGSAVIFRNGATIGDGQSAILFGPRVLFQVDERTGIAGIQSTKEVAWEGHGGLRFDPALFFPGGAGITRTITFIAMLETTDDTTPLEAKARLYNLTDGGEVTGSILTSDSLTPEMVESSALVPGSGNFKSTEAEYEVQLMLDDTYGSPGASDLITCKRAAIRVVWS